jgi:cytochrome c
MNTFELTKIMGGLCGSLLIFLLIKWGAELTYHSGHGKTHMASYYLEVEEEEEIAASDSVEELPFAEMVTLANIDKGKKIFGKCKACHKLENGVNGTGPHLYNIVGRAQASVEDYKYSTALSDMSGVWNEDELNAFLLKPTKYAPGTKMNYSGLVKINDRANLVAYLKEVSE